MTMNVPLLAHAAGLLFLYSLYGILRTCLFLMARERHPFVPTRHYRADLRPRRGEDLQVGVWCVLREAPVLWMRPYMQRTSSCGSGPEQARFTSSSLLILINRLFSISAALAIVAGQRVLRRRSPADEVNTASSTGRFWTRVRPQHAMPAYAAVAFCNFLSSSCQYEALKYVSYTSQSLAKCAKMIPVILIGSCIYGKKHQTKDWVAVAVVSLGWVALSQLLQRGALTSAAQLLHLHPGRWSRLWPCRTLPKRQSRLVGLGIVDRHFLALRLPLFRRSRVDDPREVLWQEQEPGGSVWTCVASLARAVDKH